LCRSRCSFLAFLALIGLAYLVGEAIDQSWLVPATILGLTA
jgi:hypothetical protein